MGKQINFLVQLIWTTDFVIPSHEIGRIRD